MLSESVTDAFGMNYGDSLDRTYGVDHASVHDEQRIPQLIDSAKLTTMAVEHEMSKVEELYDHVRESMHLSPESLLPPGMEPTKDNIAKFKAEIVHIVLMKTKGLPISWMDHGPQYAAMLHDELQLCVQQNQTLSATHSGAANLLSVLPGVTPVSSVSGTGKVA